MSVRMASFWLVLVVGSIGVTAGLPGAVGRQADADGWIRWVQDPAGDVAAAGLPAPLADDRLDLLDIVTRFDGLFLHLRFATAATATTVAGPGYSSNLQFNLQSGESSVDLHVEADDTGFAMRGNGTDLADTAWGVEPGGVAWAYQAWVDVAAVLGGIAPTGLRLHEPQVRTALGTAAIGDTATGPAIELQAEAVGAILDLGPWQEVTGVDLAGGTAIAMAPSGTAHLAYYVYDASRDVPIGVYHATVTRGATVEATRIGDFLPLSGERDAQTRTEIAVDNQGQAAVVYLRCPGANCSAPWRFSGDVNDWADEGLGSGLPVATTVRAKADVASWDGRLVAAIPLDDDKVVLLERGAEGWTTLHTFDEARLPKLSLGPHGLHVAFFRLTPGLHPQVDGGDLVYAAELGGWSERPVVSGIIDQTGFWDIEVDGSFGFAVDPQGRPAFAWDRWLARDEALPERGYGVLGPNGLQAEPAPLEPVHGNPQLAIRLAFDAGGNAHVMSGYGGTDLYAVRTGAGTWLRQEIDRHDVWDFAVAPNGLAAVGYTQPHGGTTLAVSFQQPTFAAGIADEAASAPGGPREQNDLPATPAALLAVALLAFVAGRR